MTPIIELKNLSVVYNLGKSNEFWALRDINLEIYPQEYIIFFGPSGCGKSTLLYTIAGLEMPTKGEVIVGGKNLKVLSKKELIKFHQILIGMIFQAYYLIPSLTVQDNIFLPQIFLGKPFFKKAQKTKTLMERFGIFDLVKKYPSELSGGQQQRVAIARALINDPEIILADEPVGNLDSKNAEIVLDLLSELNEEDKKTIIYVTHNPQDLHRANRIFYMKDGKIIRVVTNPEKKKGLPLAKKPSELEILAQIYPHFPERKLRAKLILHHLLLPYGIEEEREIERKIEDYLEGKITPHQLFEAFDLSPEKGGIGLYSQRAKELTEKIISFAKEIGKIEEKEYLSLTPIEEKAIKLRRYLLDEYEGKLTLEQIERMEEFLAQRIIGKISKEELKEYFDLPFSKGGVGLNRRTARRFSQKVELILTK